MNRTTLGYQFLGWGLCAGYYWLLRDVPSVGSALLFLGLGSLLLVMAPRRVS